MNENENDSSKNALKRNSNLVMKNFRSGQQLHGPDTTACCGHSAEFGHRLPSKLFLACSRWWLLYVGGLQSWTSTCMTDGHGPSITWRQLWLGSKNYHLRRRVVKAQPKHFVPLDFCALLWLVQSHVEIHCAQYHWLCTRITDHHFFRFSAYSVPRHLHDPSHTDAVFGRLLKTFLFSECIRGTCDDALYKLMFTYFYLLT